LIIKIVCRCWGSNSGVTTSTNFEFHSKSNIYSLYWFLAMHVWCTTTLLTVTPSSFWLLVFLAPSFIFGAIIIQSPPISYFLLAVMMLLIITVFVLITITKNHGRQSIIQSIWMSFMPRILCVSSFTFTSSSFLQGIMGHRTFQQETKSANDDSSPTRRWTF